VPAGRRPVTDGLDLDRAGVTRDDRGHIVTDDHLATTAEGVYAAGDVTGRMPFTHAAFAMGRLAAGNALSRRRRRYDSTATPWVTFTDPEVARVGITEAAAAARGGRVAHLPMSEMDRAVTAGRTDGFITLIAGPRRLLRHLGGGQIVGATIVAARAGEMIHEPALAMATNMFTGRLAEATHAYPTWSYGIQLAAAQFFVPIGGRRARRAR
jgi:pyruvate/2-oxoglutarate dehydrogenase complex dihydrolipoamide dehydrogenase (E3) component